MSLPRVSSSTRTAVGLGASKVAPPEGASATLDSTKFTVVRHDTERGAAPTARAL